MRNLTLQCVITDCAITPDQYEGYMRAAYAGAPQARIVKIDNAYHFIMIDEFDRFMGEVRTFLAE